MEKSVEELKIDTDLEDIIVYNGYKTEKYTDWGSGSPYTSTREIPIIDIDKTIENLVNIINELRREIHSLKSKN